MQSNSAKGNKMILFQCLRLIRNRIYLLACRATNLNLPDVVYNSELLCLDACICSNKSRSKWTTNKAHARYNGRPECPLPGIERQFKINILHN